MAGFEFDLRVELDRLFSEWLKKEGFEGQADLVHEDRIRTFFNLIKKRPVISEEGKAEADKLLQALSVLPAKLKEMEPTVRKNMQILHLTTPRVLKLKLLNVTFYTVEVLLQEINSRHRFRLQL